MGMVYGAMGLAGWVRYIWTNWERIRTTSMPTHVEGTSYEL
jgi:hypothetical protein